MIDIVALGGDRVRSIQDYKDWTRTRIRPIFPHDTLGSGYGHLHAGGVALDYLVTVDYPVSHLQGIRNRAGAIDTPILRRWLDTREPQLFEADFPWPDVPSAWLASFNVHGMRNAAAHAVYDTERCAGTYHSFHRIPGRLGPEHSRKLKELVPVMHEVFCRMLDILRFDNPFATGLAALSAREKQIAQWVKSGKSNGEIASLSRASANTVKHHLTSIFVKLGVETRAQLAQRLIEYEAIAKPGFVTRIV